MIRILAILVSAFSASALQASLTASPSLTNTQATLYLMINFEKVVPAINGSLQIQSPTGWAGTSCTIISPTSLGLRSQTVSGNNLVLRFLTEATRSVYLQLGPFTTPSSTVYSGFTLITFDEFNISIETLSGVQLNSLSPKTLAATLVSGSTQLATFSTLTLQATPTISC